MSAAGWRSYMRVAIGEACARLRVCVYRHRCQTMRAAKSGGPSRILNIPERHFVTASAECGGAGVWRRVINRSCSTSVSAVLLVDRSGASRHSVRWRYFPFWQRVELGGGVAQINLAALTCDSITVFLCALNPIGIFQVHRLHGAEMK